MNLYDTITQSDLNDVIDLLLNNYHREIDLNIDDSSNDYCTLEFDLSDGVDAGDEVIFNDGDNLSISISDKRLAEMGYTLRFFYYQLDKADYTGGKAYGDLQSFDVKLDTDTTVVPFEDNQVYLQKDFVLVLLKDVGYRLLLSASSIYINTTFASLIFIKSLAMFFKFKSIISCLIYPYFAGYIIFSIFL